MHRVVLAAEKSVKVEAVLRPEKALWNEANMGNNVKTSLT